MHDLPDIDLVHRLKAGDLTAFDELYLKYYKLLCVNALFLVKNEEEAKDLVQNFFLDIWGKKIFLHFQDDIKGYFYRSIKNRCLNHLEKQKTKGKNETAFAAMQQDSIPMYGEANVDYFASVRNTLEEMAPQKRLAIQMVYGKDKRYQDAADEMGISVNSFKTHLKSGLKILRNFVKK